MSLSESRQQRLLFRWSLVGYLVVVATVAIFLYRKFEQEELYSLGSYVLTSVFLVGKFVVFFGLREGAKFGPWELAFFVFLIDLGFSFLLAFGMERFESLPVLGRWLRRSRRRAGQVLADYPGLVRMAFFGVVAFVMLPLAATGAVSGSFAARFLGLSRIAGIGAICLGSLGTVTSFALLATFLGTRAEQLARSPVLVGLSVVLVLIIGRLAYVRVTTELKRQV